MSYLHLGATLYVPASRLDLERIADADRLPGLRSVIFCTEDSVAATAVSQAVSNLQQMLRGLGPGRLQRYIRVRNPEILEVLINSEGIDGIEGFVLPKIHRRNLSGYLQHLPADRPFRIMPTLETVETFDAGEMRGLRDLLLDDAVRARVTCVRIGGNDLLQLLGLRRPAGGTIYDTPLGLIISQLVTIFRPHEIPLSAPVFDRWNDPECLGREVQRDVQAGLFSKTAIHPSQVAVIESHYRVPTDELALAREILRDDAPAVFRHGTTMCEPATNWRWADQTIARAAAFGTTDVDGGHIRLPDQASMNSVSG